MQPHFFFFNDTATTEIYTLSLHDALPILPEPLLREVVGRPALERRKPGLARDLDHRAEVRFDARSEEHTSELQSPCNLVCRLLLEKKKQHLARGGPTHPRSPPTHCLFSRR